MNGNHYRTLPILFILHWTYKQTRIGSYNSTESIAVTLELVWKLFQKIGLAWKHNFTLKEKHLRNTANASKNLTKPLNFFSQA